MTVIQELREQFHKEVCDRILFIDSNGIPNNADKHSKLSVILAQGIVSQLPFTMSNNKPAGQTSGKLFEKATRNYLMRSFERIIHLRPGKWIFSLTHKVEYFEQYEHLANLSETLRKYSELRATLGDYLISPDITIGRKPVADQEINVDETVVAEDSISKLTPLRASNSDKTLLHASISCKWTIRSDRAQNVRTEGLNLVRNRKGNTPHIVIITAEPYPQRIASLALGTGDIDCVYHFALNELQVASEKEGNPAVLDMLDTLVSGKRLRDISDLPFDLAI